MRTQYELAETTLALRWSAPSVGAAVRDACEQLGLPRASQDDAHPSLVLALRVAGTTPTAPEHAEPVADFDEVELSAHRADDHLFLQGPGVVARLDPALGAGRLELHPSALDDLEGLHGLLSGMLPVGLFALLRPRQCYPLHAAALVPVGSETDGVLLVAHRDSGKSILSYSLARQGWSFLSDDSVLLRRNEGAGVDAGAFVPAALHDGRRGARPLPRNCAFLETALRQREQRRGRPASPLPRPAPRALHASGARLSRNR